jgi:aspartate-semialdehyde dehydrogenase
MGRVKVAVVGATGAVGRTMLEVLAERAFPVAEVVALASARSAGVRLPLGAGDVEVRALSPGSFSGVRIALFSAGASVSREMAPVAAAAGAVVVDNSSAWRMDPQCPLVVPEVNPAAARDRPKGIIANPNCSTIQLVVALQPLHAAARLRRVVVSTYQAVSGKGAKATAELRRQVDQSARGDAVRPEVFARPILGNCLVDWKPGADGYTEEEWKMVHETRKIMGLPDVEVSPTTVRVPVENGHSESVHAEFERPITAARARQILSAAPGVVVLDDPAHGVYPTPLEAAGRDEVFVGRIRQDPSRPNALNLWVVSDNLRKGAATNAVQIAEGVLAE